VSRAKEHLGCPIPKRYDFMGIRSHGDAERTCEPEVCQLEIVLFVDEKVLRFEVSMQYSVGMAVQEAGG